MRGAAAGNTLAFDLFYEPAVNAKFDFGNAQDPMKVS